MFYRLTKQSKLLKNTKKTKGDDFLTNEITQLLAENAKLITGEVYDESIKQIFAEIKTKAEWSHTHCCSEIKDSRDKRIPTIAKQSEWDNKVSKAELNSAVNTFASGLQWKGVHNTLADLKRAITSPREGFFVIVTREPKYNNKNTMLIYETEGVNDWQTIGDLFSVGVATSSQDGLMASSDKRKLDGLRNYTLPKAETTRLGGVKINGGGLSISSSGVLSVDSNQVVSSSERAKWNNASTNASNALGRVGNAERDITQNTNNISQLTSAVSNISNKFNYLSVEDAKNIIKKYA